jgi:ferredoxin-thioredoxin reductase catalytic subunit
MNPVRPGEADPEGIYRRLKEEAEKGGYRLNPDEAFTLNLIAGLLKNEGRYGYRACPCRLASGRKDDDLDIICPCDYRDPDLAEFGACYCALYVSEEVRSGIQQVSPVPERRPPRSERKKQKTSPLAPAGPFSPLAYPVWRCRVCGYLCARDQPPGVCPICKVTSDRFERFI